MPIQAIKNLSDQQMRRQAKLKSAFVIVHILSALTILAASVATLTQGGSIAWLGPLLTSGAFVGFLVWAMLTSAARTPRDLPLLTLVGLIGLVIALFGAALGSGDIFWPVGLAGFSFVANLTYIYWFSRLTRRPSRVLEIGKPMPDFELQDLSGEAVDGGELCGQPTILLFFRGNWCPLCMAQIKEIAALYREIEDRGGRVFLVSPQSHEKSQELARKMQAPMRFLTDIDNVAAKQLDIYQEDGVPVGLNTEKAYGAHTVFPTIIVTDGKGIVRHLDQTDNYRVRPEPASFIDVLERFGGMEKSEDAQPQPA